MGAAEARCLDADAEADLLLRGLAMRMGLFICYAHLEGVCREQRGKVTMPAASGAKLMRADQPCTGFRRDGAHA